jgi:hypothetical protein
LRDENNKRKKKKVKRSHPLVAFFSVTSVADPDPAYDSDADTDPACHFEADPDSDPTFHFNADPDPDPSFQRKALKTL